MESATLGKRLSLPAGDRADQAVVLSESLTDERDGELALTDEQRAELNRQDALRQSRGDRLAVEILHHPVIDAVLVADVVQRADVRVGECGDRVRFAIETLSLLDVVDGTPGAPRSRRSDRDAVLHAIDLAYSPGAERGEDLVWGPGERRFRWSCDEGRIMRPSHPGLPSAFDVGARAAIDAVRVAPTQTGTDLRARP